MKSGTRKIITTAIILIVFALVTGTIAIGKTGGTQSSAVKNVKNTQAAEETFDKISCGSKAERTETDTVNHTVGVKNGTSDTENVNKRKWHETFGTGHNLRFMSVKSY